MFISSFKRFSFLFTLERGKMDEMTKLPRSLHFVGVGGIGMSGLAQLAAGLGLTVTGSDRAFAAPENARIFRSLEAQGVRIFPQDGSVYAETVPDALVYSTAIEPDNADFSRAPAGTPRLHRSKALELLVGACRSAEVTAVAGTCGKTSVTAHLTEALNRLGADPGMLCGGLVNSLVTDRYAGNFRPGSGAFVLEADESDQSLLNYTPDSALVLNIGTDHYPKDVLARVFGQFIRNTRRNAVLAASVLDAVGKDVCAGKNILIFHDGPPGKGAPVYRGFPAVRLDSCRIADGHAYCSFDGQAEITLAAPGFHNALNALAVYAALRLDGYEKAEAASAAGSFSGVWRRFDYAGKTRSGITVYDDYAHNVEKLLSCLRSAQSISAGGVMILFQPHGFGPFGFMRDELFRMLEKNLRDQDVFGFLPVYYAGGTSSFKPSAAEVAESYRILSGRPERYPDFSGRADAEKYLFSHLKNGETAVIAGARDNSLSLWAKKIAFRA